MNKSCNTVSTQLLSRNKIISPPIKDIQQMAIEILSFLPRDERRKAVLQIQESTHD
jgi:hypothetical protein